MTNSKIVLPEIDYFDPDNYLAETLEDEIKVDENCKILLKNFHQYLLGTKSIAPLEAGSMASGADYYLRDYMIDNRRANIFTISVALIRGFAGNWYIINNLNPNMAELESILTGVANFYGYCHANRLISPTTATQIDQACADLIYYRQRIESFHSLIGDGYSEWNKSCPMP
ncbi:MAG: hypothetical protein KAU22_08850 [Desulfuromonadales bacterium]|nr:hypothetical protein [Desulfuromonadales bacterium]